MARHSRVAAVLTAFLFAACESAIVPARDRHEAYDFRLPIDQDSVVLRWPNASRIRVFLNAGNNAEHNTRLNEAFRHASTAWEAASLYGDYRFAQVGRPEDADVIVTMSSVILPVETAQCMPGGGAAFTTFCVTNARDRLEPFPLRGSNLPSSVRFVVTIRESEASTSERIRALVTHELGHVLGIAQHSPDMQDLMFTDPLVRALPNTRDRVTVQLLYQSRADITP